MKTKYNENTMSSNVVYYMKGEVNEVKMLIVKEKNVKELVVLVNEKVVFVQGYPCEWNVSDAKMMNNGLEYCKVRGY